MKTSSRPQRLTLGLHRDLAERTHLAAAALCLNSNYFVNKCVEDCLNAMESDQIVADVPIVQMMRRVCGRPVLASHWVLEICAIFSPRSLADITPRHYRAFAELVDGHEGELTEDIVRLYWRLAETRVERQFAFDAELARLKEGAEDDA